MRDYEKLLVGIDLTPEGNAISSGSRLALQQARWLAEKTGASLVLAHSTWADLYEDAGSIRHGTSPAGKQALEALVQELEGAGFSVELSQGDERPWIDVIKTALRSGAQLVFVGRRNEPGAKQLGSTSMKLLRDCPVPVWVVKPDAVVEYEKILVATDLTPVGDRAVALAADVASGYGAELHIVHAWQVPFEAQMERDAKGQEQLDVLQRSAEEHVLRSFEASGADLEPILHIGCDAPSRAILEGVEVLPADLLVMGTVSRSGVAGLLVGNTAERLLDRVECSLLTIKPEDFVSPVDPR